MLIQGTAGAELERLAIIGMALFVVAVLLISWLAWRERGSGFGGGGGGGRW